MPLFEPLRRLKLVLLIFLNHLVALSCYEDTFGSLGLTQAIISGNNLLNGAFSIILELNLPVIECLGIGIAVLRDICQRLLIEHLVLIFIQLHELVQIQNGLEHSSWSVLTLN